MSKNTKLLITLLAVVAIGAGAYYGYLWYQGKDSVGSNVFSDEPATLPSGTSTTDASLDKDAAAIDASLKGLDTDSASADASLKESAQVQ